MKVIRFLRSARTGNAFMVVCHFVQGVGSTPMITRIGRKELPPTGEKDRVGRRPHL